MIVNFLLDLNIKKLNLKGTINILVSLSLFEIKTRLNGLAVK